MEEQDLFQSLDGGSIPTSPLQVKWEIPYYSGFLSKYFAKDMELLNNPKQLNIKNIDNSIANDFVFNHHYLRRKVYIAKNISYGVFYKSWLIGVVMFGYPVWTTYPEVVPPYLPEEVPELLRVSLLSCCPKNSCSRVLSICFRFLINDWYAIVGKKPKIIFSMSDSSLGFEGTIYKSAGFTFLKTTIGRPANIGKSHGRWGYNKDKTKSEKKVWIKKI